MFKYTEVYTSDVTAVADQDYSELVRDVIFREGEDRAVIDVVVNELDTVMEGSESFILSMRNIQGAEEGFPNVAKIIIEDDDCKNLLLLYIHIRITSSAWCLPVQTGITNILIMCQLYSFVMDKRHVLKTFVLQFLHVSMQL